MTDKKVLELFAGKGAFTKAMRNKNIPFHLVGFSEIDEAPIKAYCAIHNVDESLNLGSVTEINATNLDVDIVVHGSPCQSYTRAGKGEGGDEGSGTRSSLMWETVRIVKECSPNVVIWEQVPDVLSKKHKHNFDKYIEDLTDLGYISHYKILNANDQGSAQKRKRLIVVSIDKDCDFTFEFPLNKSTFKPLSSYLENNVDEKYSVPKKVIDELILGRTEDSGYKIKNATKQGYLVAYEDDGIDWSFPTSKTRRGRVQRNMCQTLTTSKSIGTIQNGIARYFTPLEYWRLQEFTDQDYELAKSTGLNDDDMYHLAGNSINVKVLEAVYNELFK